MADLVLFHSALGRRPAVDALAATLRRDGHAVTVPDLYDGAAFDDLDAGVSERDRIGVPELLRRATLAVEGLAAELVYVGISMGTAPAQLLATTRPGARGVVLIQGVLPLEAIGLEVWPHELACQLHTSRDDAWHEQRPVDELLAAVPDGQLEHHEYPGCGHLFLDDGLPEHDALATAALTTSLRSWLAQR